jgi:hypothetical protein
MTEAAENPPGMLHAWSAWAGGFVRSSGFRVVMRSWFAQLGLMAVAFGLMRMLFETLMRQREDIYFNAFLGVGFASRGFASLIAGLLFAWVLLNRRRVNWRRMGSKARMVMAAVMLTATWCIIGVSFNYYTGHAYFVDRALIVVLLGATLWRPAFAIPLLAYLMVFLGQHHAGAGDWELTDKFPIIDAMSAFVAWMVLRTLMPLRVRTLFWFLLALQAINYLAPGIAKLTLDDSFNPLGWYTENPLHLLSLTAWHHGWLSFLSAEDATALVRWASHLDVPMAVFTMIVEVGAPLLVLSRRTAVLWLGGAVMLHLGIFGMTGILFWIWVVLDLSLRWWMGATRRKRTPRVRERAVALLVLIAAFPLFAKPKFLGWIDTPVSEHYFIEVETDDGTFRVDHADFSPYDVTFEQGALHYVNRKRVVTYSWGGGLTYDVGIKLGEAETPDQVRTIIAEHGLERANEKHAAVLDTFLRKFFANVNEYGDMRWVSDWGPPTHMQVRSGDPRFQFDARVRRVNVRFVRTFFDGETIHTMDDEVVRTVIVP